MAETVGDLVRSYVRSLRWQVPLSVGVMVALWALDARGARQYGIGFAILLGLGLVFVLGPLMWLRSEYLGRSDRPFWAFFGLSLLWALVAFSVVIGLLALFGVD